MDDFERFKNNYEFLVARYLQNPRGLHPQLKRRIEKVLGSLDELVADTQEIEATSDLGRLFPSNHVFMRLD
jgi:hypothetical protein